MSNLEMVFSWTKKLESALKQYGAEGKGLTEYTKSLERVLPYDLCKELKDIAWIRNQLAHVDGFEMKNPPVFEQRCKNAFSRLDPAFVLNAKKALEAIDRVIQPVTGPETGPQSRIYAASRLVSDELAANLLQIMERGYFGKPVSGWVDDPEQFKQLCNKTYKSLLGELGARGAASKPAAENAAYDKTLHTPSERGGSLFVKIAAAAVIFILFLSSFFLYSANRKIRDEMQTTLMKRASVIRDLEAKVIALNGALHNERNNRDSLTKTLNETIAALERKVSELEGEKSAGASTAVRKEVGKKSTTAVATAKQSEGNLTKASQNLSFGALAQSKKDKDAATADIKYGFFEKFSKDLQVTLGKTTYNVNGSTVDIVIPVTWTQPDGNSFERLLNKYFQSSNGNPLRYEKSPFFSSDHVGLKISKYCNSGDEFKKPYSESLYNLMAKKKILIRISAGSYSSKLTIAGASDNAYWVQFYGGPKVKSLVYDEINPVIIKGVPLKEAQKITSVSAEVIVK